MLNSKALSASVSSPPKIYVEDVFSTYLYTGNDSTQTITNGIDLAGEGGLVWLKNRNFAGGQDHFLHNSARGFNKGLRSNTTDAEFTDADQVVASSTGFTVGSSANISPYTYASWTFRKAPKFFDIVTYTGNGSARTISHNLGSVPGAIWVKRTDTTGDWQCYHRSLANTQYMVLNSDAAVATGATRWNSTTPTSSVFSLGTDATVNASAGTYVAYVFAHDAGGFGDAGTDSVVKCGSFTTDGSGNATVNLGWEPQWLLCKAASGFTPNGRLFDSWTIADNMRRFDAPGGTNTAYLRANLSNGETESSDGYKPTSTGFEVTVGGLPSATFVYIAIRRGPMKTPTDATKVFAASTAGTGNNTPGFVTDNLWTFYRDGGSGTEVRSRLQGNTPYLVTSSTAAEATGGNYKWDTNNGVNYTWGNPYIGYYFRRAPGFFDVVAYTGTGSAQTVNHNLGVVPELMIVKKRSAADAWVVYANNDNTDYLVLNTTAATVDDNTIWNDTSPTSSVFTVGTNDDVNGNTATLIAYLFATCPGVSKVGTYTGTGTTLNIDCGFTAGARFVLIKRTDSSGDWYVWDTARGIVSGNDPYLLLNSTAAEDTSTDYIDPLNTGFQISSSAPAAINANGGGFIYLAVA